MVDFAKLKKSRSGRFVLTIVQKTGDLETVDRELVVTHASGDYDGITWFDHYADAVGLAATISYDWLRTHGLPDDADVFTLTGRMSITGEEDEDQFDIERVDIISVTVKAERHHHTTCELTVIDVSLIKRNDAVYLLGGPTGHESFVVRGAGDADLERLKIKGWYACKGTIGQWDSLYVPPVSMQRALDVLKL